MTTSQARALSVEVIKKLALVSEDYHQARMKQQRAVAIILDHD